MTTFAGSVAVVDNHRGCNQGASWPDTFGIMHHEGVILEVQGGYEQSPIWLELDYGRDGLKYTIWEVKPDLHAVIPQQGEFGGMRYLKAAIPSEQSSPQRLIDMLDRI